MLFTQQGEKMYNMDVKHFYYIVMAVFYLLRSLQKDRSKLWTKYFVMNGNVILH